MPSATRAVRSAAGSKPTPRASTPRRAKGSSALHHLRKMAISTLNCVAYIGVGNRWDQPDLGPCGGLVETYEAWCNYYQLKPNHGLVQHLSTLSLWLFARSYGNH